MSGSADISYSSSDISKSIDSNTQWSIRPNVDSPAVDELISSLSALARGEAAENANLYEELSKSAQDILSGDEVDPIQAIVIPLRSVSAVHEKFGDNPDAAVECISVIFQLCQ